MTARLICCSIPGSDCLDSHPSTPRTLAVKAQK